MARKPKATPGYFEIPVFPIPIFGGKLLLCVTREEWSSVAYQYDSDPDTDGCKGLSIQYRTPEEGRVYCIGVFDGAIDTFVHELAHAVFHILGDVGIPVEDGAANEAFAYIQGHLMKESFPSFLAAIAE
ncbi:UNVERIFIED_ORG: hypothetical protein ABIC54_004473 [Burkholderia sp. 1263]